MNQADYCLVYSQGTAIHESVILRLANFTPEESEMFRLIRQKHNPDARYLESVMCIDARQRRRIEHGMRLKVAWVIMEAIREYGENHR